MKLTLLLHNLVVHSKNRNTILPCRNIFEAKRQKGFCQPLDVCLHQRVADLTNEAAVLVGRKNVAVLSDGRLMEGRKINH